MVVKNKGESIAVVGSGIAGLSSAYFLSKSYDVTLYESESRLGGHSNAVMVSTPQGPLPIDTGFIVCNTQNYPHFLRFLSELGITPVNSDMSFSYAEKNQNNADAFYYSSDIPFGLFAQTKNWVSPSFWKFLIEITQFNQTAISDFSNRTIPDISLKEYLTQKKFSELLIRQYVTPMGAAIWSASQSEMDQFPARAFIQFWVNHGLLSVSGRPQWKTIPGGSATYVSAAAQKIEANGGEICLGASVKHIHRNTDRVTITTEAGDTRPFSKVVVATHADQALRLLADPTTSEVELLGSWRYSQNPTFLHTDSNLMPNHRRSWASWNYLFDATSGLDSLPTVSYYMNRLQNLNAQADYFVTLNPSAARFPAEDKIIAQFSYTHPIFDSRSMATQSKLPQLNGVNQTYFCGSYFGFGFHEDAIRSSVSVAHQLGVQW